MLLMKEVRTLGYTVYATRFGSLHYIYDYNYLDDVCYILHCIVNM